MDQKLTVKEMADKVAAFSTYDDNDRHKLMNNLLMKLAEELDELKAEVKRLRRLTSGLEGDR